MKKVIAAALIFMNIMMVKAYSAQPNQQTKVTEVAGTCAIMEWNTHGKLQQFILNLDSPMSEVNLEMQTGYNCETI